MKKMTLYAVLTAIAVSACICGCGSSYSTTAEKVECTMCNGTGKVKYYYGASAEEAARDGQPDYKYGVCTSCDGKGYNNVIPKNRPTESNKVICPSCYEYVSSLISREDNAGETYKWCASCWKSYDKIMGN